jgi:hypothetical protein
MNRYGLALLHFAAQLIGKQRQWLACDSAIGYQDPQRRPLPRQFGEPLPRTVVARSGRGPAICATARHCNIRTWSLPRHPSLPAKPVQAPLSSLAPPCDVSPLRLHSSALHNGVLLPGGRVQGGVRRVRRQPHARGCRPVDGGAAGAGKGAPVQSPLELIRSIHLGSVKAEVVQHLVAGAEFADGSFHRKTKFVCVDVCCSDCDAMVSSSLPHGGLFT